VVQVIEFDNWRQRIGAVGFRAYVTDPSGRRVHKTAVHATDEDATAAGWDLVGIERARGKFKPRWWARFLAGFYRIFPIRRQERQW
jgi:hypothetical protein